MLNYLMVWSGFNVLLSLALFKEKNLKKGMCWTSFLVTTGIFLLCFSHSSILQIIMTFSEIRGLAVFCFNIGLAFLLSGIYIVFIHSMRDPFFRYSPYVLIIGIGLLTIYFQLIMSF